MPQAGLGSKYAEIRTDASAGFQFHQLPVRPVDWPGLTHSREMGRPTAKVTVYQDQGPLRSKTVHVPDRSTYSHRETGLLRSTSYETHSVALEATLAHFGDLGKDYPDTQISPFTPRVVVRREKRTPESTVASPRLRSTNVYRRLKRRLGITLRGLHCKRRVVKHRKSLPYQFSGVKSSLPGPQELQASLQGSDCSSSNGQHNCVCPPLKASVMVPSQGNSPEGQTHPRPLECYNGQIFQTQTSDSAGMVPISAGVQSLVFQMEPTTARPFYNLVQSQTSQVCVTGTGSKGLGSRRLEPDIGEPRCLRLSTSVTTQQGSFQGDRPGLSQNDSDCTRLAQHALVWGSSQSVDSDTIHAHTTAGSGDTAVQRAPSPESQEPEPACQAPRVSVI